MLTIAECRKILTENKKEYTDEEVLAMRDWMYRLADIVIELVEQKDSTSSLSNTNQDKNS